MAQLLRARKNDKPIPIATGEPAWFTWEGGRAISSFEILVDGIILNLSPQEAVDFAKFVQGKHRQLPSLLSEIEKGK